MVEHQTLNETDISYNVKMLITTKGSSKSSFNVLMCKMFIIERFYKH